MNDDFSKYEQLRISGATAENVFLSAKCDGLDLITLIRMIRAVYCLSVTEAKEVMIRAEGIASSLDEHQEAFVDTVSKYLQNREVQ